MVQIPGQANVSQVGASATRAPGVRADADAFGAAGGQGLQQIGEALTVAADQIQTRDDTVERARAVSTYNDDLIAELTRLQTEGDFSQNATAEEFNEFARTRASELLGAHSGRANSRTVLETRLEGVRSTYAMKAASLRLKGQETLILDTLGKSMNSLTASAYQAPGDLPSLYGSLDALVDDMAPALSPEAEMEHRTIGRAQIAVSALESFFDRGQFDMAQQLMNETPGLMEVLSPEKQRELQGRVVQFQQEQDKARQQGIAKVNELRAVLGREPTPVERAQFAGVAPAKAERTLRDKIDEAETALGRPLTQGERQRLIGLEPSDKPQAQSKAGKLVEDRQRFVDEYGDDSPQVRAFDELANSKEPPKLTDIGGQRKEFTKLSGVFVDVRDAFNRITTSASEPSAAGDLSLLINYMKMLDPGSVVRESEFQTVAETGSFGERVTAALNRYLSGERLTPEIRADFVERSEMLMQQQVSTQARLEQQFLELAQRSGFDPKDVVIDFLGPFRPGGEQPAGDAAGGAAEEEKPKPKFQVDLDGNIIGGGEQ